MQDLNL